jgi:hypothetical protein
MGFAALYPSYELFVQHFSARSASVSGSLSLSKFIAACFDTDTVSDTDTDSDYHDSSA